MNANNNINTNFSLMQKIEFILNIINHILVTFISIYLSWMCFRIKLYKTGLHAWLCAIGYNLLMVEGIMCHYSGNILTLTSTRKTKTTAHWILMAVGGGLGIIGGIIKIAEKNIHFTTLHGLTGLISMVLTGFSFLTGISSLFSQSFKSYFRLKPVLNKGFHNLLGLASFVIGMVSMFYGYETGFFIRKTEPDFATMMKVFTLINIVLSSIGPIKSLANKILSLMA